MTNNYQNRAHRSAGSANKLSDTESGIEVHGQIDWFDQKKGFGFIKADDPAIGKIMIHITALRRSGFNAAAEGARIIVLAKKGDRGMQAYEILFMDTSAANIHAELSNTLFHVDRELERAIVKWFNRSKGFGFATLENDKKDAFIHGETLRRFGLTELRAGQEVVVRCGLGDKGLIVSEIYPDIGVRTNPILPAIQRTSSENVVKDSYNLDAQDSIEDAVIEQIFDMTHSQSEALSWYENFPIAAFGGLTAKEALAQGYRDALLEYLGSMREGGFA